MKDCQWWIKEVARELVAKGVLADLPEEGGTAVRSPEEVVAGLPVH